MTLLISYRGCWLAGTLISLGTYVNGSRGYEVRLSRRAGWSWIILVMWPNTLYYCTSKDISCSSNGGQWRCFCGENWRTNRRVPGTICITAVIWQASRDDASIQVYIGFPRETRMRLWWSNIGKYIQVKGFPS